MILSERIPYFLLMIFAAAISIFVAILAFRSRRKVARAKPFALMALSGSAWMIFVSLDIIMSSHAWKDILWWLIPFAILCTIICLFVFSLEFSLRLAHVPKAVLYPIAAIALAIWVLSATNNIHSLMWSVTIVNGYYTQVMGNFFWIQLTFTYLLTLGSLVLLVRAYLLSKGMLRRQTVFLLVGILIPIFISIVVDVLGWNPLAFIDESALSIIIAVLLFGFVTLRFNNLYLLPIASDVIIKNMRDIVLVTDAEGLIIFSNPAAQLVLGGTVTLLIGYHVSKVLAGWLPEAFDAWNEKKEEAQLIFEQEDIRYFRLTISKLSGNSGESIGYLLMIHDNTGQKKYEKSLNELAIRDPLTGSYNTRYFYEMAQTYFNQTLRTSKPLSLMMIDLDHFKKINDTYGHLKGDNVISSVALICECLIRPQDIFSRYGGEEFVLAMPETSLQESLLVAERFRSAIEALNKDVEDIPVTVSIGVAQSTGEADLTLDILLNRADEAMYLSKRAGRNRSTAWESSHLKLDEIK